MKALKYIFIAIGVFAILLTIYLLIVGIKVVSTVVFYITATIAAIAVIIFLIYSIGKFVGKREGHSN